MSSFNLPDKLQDLSLMAQNYYWSWSQDVWPLYERLSPEKWTDTRNPVACLQSASPNALEQLAGDPEYVSLVKKKGDAFRKYLNEPNTWYAKNFANTSTELIAYFSAEFGIHEALPIYSGGLGVLAGDHVKSSSDLGVPMVFVGLFYSEGYFTQQIDSQGQQQDVYAFQDPQSMSLSLMKSDSGSPLNVSVKIAERNVDLQIWRAEVGRNSLYLLDSNIDTNSTNDRQLTSRLYGGDREMRIAQEIILGIGGIHALKALKLEPTAFHMNEGHSGFFQLQRVLNTMSEKQVNFEEARLLCSANCLFTTHTPVPAGNETFELPLIHKYFYQYVKQLDISWHRFLELGLVSEKSDYKYFSLTVFALNFSRFYNGVSELHGRIAKKMWRSLWKDVPEVDNPISHITNGVHVPTWTCLEFKNLFAQELDEDWISHLSDQNFWDRIREIPDAKIKNIKIERKKKLIQLVRRLMAEQLHRNGESPNAISEVKDFLDENVLTIGFARRFATYKRATLIFKDEERLAKIVNNPDRPVQFIFAGKAHPADIPGQEFIKKIYQISRKPEFKGKIVILENYDMNISRHMVSGVDVWLNNPRRPMEASGTSGQKVPLNFGINFSVLDGWWREGYDGKNGWTIGKEKDYPSDDVQDLEDANDFYSTLEETIIPLYLSTSDSDNWITRTKESLISNIARFSTYRMVQDYTQKFYIPAINYGKYFSIESNKEHMDAYIKTRRFLRRNWGAVTFTNVSLSGAVAEAPSKYPEYKLTPSHHTEFPVDDTLPGRVFETVQSKIEISAYLGEMTPEHVKAEIVVTDSEKRDEISYMEMNVTDRDDRGCYTFSADFASKDKSTKRLRIRLVPTMPHLQNKFEFGYTAWL
ncbi:MAG: alpha-glucan family phosphorylase [Bdellovibrionales bacterium]|nr:alpha-glucan family phosphorylase [Bdellovibrionales bacterium]